MASAQEILGFFRNAPHVGRFKPTVWMAQQTGANGRDYYPFDSSPPGTALPNPALEFWQERWGRGESSNVLLVRGWVWNPGMFSKNRPALSIVCLPGALNTYRDQYSVDTRSHPHLGLIGTSFFALDVALGSAHEYDVVMATLRSHPDFLKNILRELAVTFRGHKVDLPTVYGFGLPPEYKVEIH